MGWSSATEIFDTVVDDTNDLKLDEGSKEQILWNLALVLREKDWDNMCESKFVNDPIVKKIFKEL